MLKQGEVFGHQRVADLINLCKSLSCHVHTLSCQKVAAVLNALLLNVSEVAACLQASTAPINELFSYCRILIWKGFKTEGLEGLALIVASEYLRLSADHLLSCAILDQSFMYMVCRLHATNAVFLPDAGYFLESVAATVCRFRGKIGPRTISKVAIRSRFRPKIYQEFGISVLASFENAVDHSSKAMGTLTAVLEAVADLHMCTDTTAKGFLTLCNATICNLAVCDAVVTGASICYASRIVLLCAGIVCQVNLPPVSLQIFAQCAEMLRSGESLNPDNLSLVTLTAKWEGYSVARVVLDLKGVALPELVPPAKLVTDSNQLDELSIYARKRTAAALVKVLPEHKILLGPARVHCFLMADIGCFSESKGNIAVVMRQDASYLTGCVSEKCPSGLELLKELCLVAQNFTVMLVEEDVAVRLPTTQLLREFKEALHGEMP